MVSSSSAKALPSSTSICMCSLPPIYIAHSQPSTILPSARIPICVGAGLQYTPSIGFLWLGVHCQWDVYTVQYIDEKTPTNTRRNTSSSSFSSFISPLHSSSSYLPPQPPPPTSFSGNAAFISIQPHRTICHPKFFFQSDPKRPSIYVVHFCEILHPFAVPPMLHCLLITGVRKARAITALISLEGTSPPFCPELKPHFYRLFQTWLSHFLKSVFALIRA